MRWVHTIFAVPTGPVPLPPRALRANESLAEPMITAKINESPMIAVCVPCHLDSELCSAAPCIRMDNDSCMENTALDSSIVSVQM
jgi:hypothetical protein